MFVDSQECPLYHSSCTCPHHSCEPGIAVGFCLPTTTGKKKTKTTQSVSSVSSVLFGVY